MSNMQESLIKEFADFAATATASKVMASLQEITATLSGDDSGLTNAWEEVCVQVQGEESVDWETYREIMNDFVRAELESLPYRDRAALWLQTDDGSSWYLESDGLEQHCTDEDRSADEALVPYELPSIVEYIVEQYLVPTAERFSNRNIEAYLSDESSDEDDDEEVDDELRERLIELMPRDSMVIDLWDWDIHFEESSFDDIADAGFADDAELAQYADTLSSDFQQWIDEYDMDYNQQGCSSPEEFSEWIEQQCLDFMKKWRANVKIEFGR